MPEFITVNQAIGMLSVSRLTIHRKIKSGEIPSVHLGKRVLIPVEFLKQLRDKAFGTLNQEHKAESKTEARR